MLRRAAPSVLLSLAAALALAGPAAAQGDPPAGGHAPAADEGAPGEASGQEDGPNLQVPAWIGGRVKERLEAAVATWKEAFARFRSEGPDAARDDVEAAIEVLQGVRDLDRHCALPDYYLGIAYQLTGDHEEAIERLEEAIERNQRFHEAMVELGDARRWAGDEEAAEAAYAQAIETDPSYGHAYYMRALMRAAQQRFEESREDVARAKELKPGDAAVAALEKRLDLVLDGPDWEEKFEVETRNYVVRTNVSEEFAEEIANKAELIRRLYEDVFPRSRSRRKSPIVVFATKQEYHAHGGPANAGGHFDPVFKQLFLFRYDDPADTSLVLYHEGFHQFLDGVLEEKAPQWFNEGLADYFGPAEYVNEGGAEGMRIQPNPWRLRLVKQMIQAERYVPFERLMNMSRAEMYDPRAASLHYAQAWSIIYFLAEADDRAHFHYLADYFKALRRGKGQREAYEKAFGRADMEAMEARWKEFMLAVRPR